MYTSAENFSKDAWRSAFNRPRVQYEEIDDSELLATLPAKEEESVHWQRGLELVVESVAELPEETQRIFSLFHFSHKKSQEIADELGITRRTVDRHMARAVAHSREKLRDYFEDQ